MSKILVVDDEPGIVESLDYALRREGHSVVIAQDGVTALELAAREQPDLVILDIMLPEMDGFEVCRRIRQRSNVPILMLTARADEVDKVVGLEVGADDYLTKPFSLRELVARVKAMLRRAQLSSAPSARDDASEVLRANGLEIDLGQHRVTLGGTPLSLRPKEFDLLAFLVRHRGRVFSRDVLLERVWGYDFPGDTRTVDVHIRWLREKIEEEPSRPRYLETVRGVGYRFSG